MPAISESCFPYIRIDPPNQNKKHWSGIYHGNRLPFEGNIKGNSRREVIGKLKQKYRFVKIDPLVIKEYGKGERYKLVPK